eukprot:237979-Amphidinium_carterae.1
MWGDSERSEPKHATSTNGVLFLRILLYSSQSNAIYQQGSPKAPTSKIFTSSCSQQSERSPSKTHNVVD